MVTQYKCPGCNSDFVFDITTGMLKCPHCGTTMSIKDAPKTELSTGSGDDNPAMDPFDPNDIEDEQTFEYSQERNIPHSEFSDNDVNEYLCNNCGGVILADKETTATHCSYCGSPVILADRLSSRLAPANVIPFHITKDQAQKRFEKWCKNGRFTPNSFKRADRVKHITGMYVPFWLFDMNGHGDIDATCTKVHTHSNSQYRTTETSYFHVYRKINLNYVKVPVDASEKMNDDLMDKLEPYNYSEMRTFQMPYLSGFLAEKYDYTDEEMLPRVRKRIESYVNSYIPSTMLGYSSTRINQKNIIIQKNNAFYTLLPVWMVYYDYHDSEHVFLMNGQTGKVVGKPPIEKKKVAYWFTGIFIGLFAVLKVIGYFLLGGRLL